MKGAFKNHPIEQQPIRISNETYLKLSDYIHKKLSNFGDIYIPSIKKSVKPDNGDIDIIINPNDRNRWKATIIDIFNENIIAMESNGCQLMLVVNGVIDNNNYMLDFILCENGCFDFRCNYAKFGTIIPAVIGSFARSLHYKFDQNSLYIRIKDNKNNYHNMLLTNNFITALKILDLDHTLYNTDLLFESNIVANWVINSKRFDCNLWNNKTNITVKNRNANTAIKTHENIKTTFNIIDSSTKTQILNNDNYKIERFYLGDDYIDNILSNINKINKKQTSIITGNDIMDILKIKPSPIIGELLKTINKRNYNRQEAINYIKTFNKEK